MSLNVALVGDYNEDVLAHKAIPLAIDLASDRLGLVTKFNWISTDSVNLSLVNNYDAIWCVPGSPYKNMNGALLAIHFARENNIPFLGTCGGYQHAVLEYARNKLGYKNADNSEVNPEAEMPLISVLSCKLVDENDIIILKRGSITAKFYQSIRVEEGYHCTFGVNPKYLSIFNDSDMKFIGFDVSGDPRAFELNGHPFYIGTAYQPERSAFEGKVHPLIVGLINAARSKNINYPNSR